MRSALSSPVGGVPLGTVTVGAWPAVPAGDRSAAGMVPMAVLCPAALVVVVGETFAALDELEGDELQAARPSAPAAARATRASARRRRVRRGMGRDGSRWSPGCRGTVGPGCGVPSGGRVGAQCESGPAPGAARGSGGQPLLRTAAPLT